MKDSYSLFNIAKEMVHKSVATDVRREPLGRTISKYDEIFIKESERLGWDWVMLASLVWNESRFNNDIVSSQGARGLMQFMPRTAERFGLVGDEILDPEKTIAAGVDYLLFLDKRFLEIENRCERQKFVLASYNAGPGHVRDAMALAEKYGDNPHIWSGSVDKWMLALQESKYYADEVCKYGFFRGMYTVRYVENIFKKYMDFIEET
jgi:membrane-bound lytic murein transglycosylase F